MKILRLSDSVPYTSCADFSCTNSKDDVAGNCQFRSFYRRTFR